MHHSNIRQVLICICNSRRRVRRWLHVVGAVHHQQVMPGRMHSQGNLDFGQLGRKLGRVPRRQAGAVAIAVPQVSHQHLRSIRGLPPELARHIADSAPYSSSLDAKAAQDLRDLPRMAKRIWNITHLHLGTKPLCRTRPLQQVADVCLGAHQEHIWQDMPRPDQYPPALHVSA